MFFLILIILLLILILITCPIKETMQAYGLYGDVPVIFSAAPGHGMYVENSRDFKAKNHEN